MAPMRAVRSTTDAILQHAHRERGAISELREQDGGTRREEREKGQLDRAALREPAARRPTADDARAQRVDRKYAAVEKDSKQPACHVSS